MGDMSREPSMEDILSSIRRVIARDEATVQARVARVQTVDDVLDLRNLPIDAAADKAIESPGPIADPIPVIDENLISTASVEATRQSLDALNSAFALAPNAVPTSRTIDDVVMEALRPMLKSWLDQNLPPIVEAMVAKEIRRITGAR